MKRMVEKIRRIESTAELKYKIKANIRDRIKERGYIEKHKITRAPRYVHIELNNTCNLKCVMCSYSTMKRPKQYMSIDTYKRVINDCVRSGILYVRLFAMGEPLLHPKFFEMVKYAKSKGIGFVDINSNANLLTMEKSKQILESGLDRVVFSVDGSDEETYRKIRIGGSLKKVKENINYLMEQRKKMKKHKPLVIVQTIKMKETEKQINEIVNYWGSIVDRVGVCDVMDQSEQIKSVARGKTKWKKDASKISANERKIPCPLLWTMMTITPNGDVSACCGDTDVLLKIGNVNESSLLEIWNGKKLNWLRKMHLDKKFNAMPLCGECEVIDNKK